MDWKRSKLETPSKIVENDRAKILWESQVPIDTLVVAKQPDIVVVEKQHKRLGIPSESNIRKKEHEKVE